MIPCPLDSKNVDEVIDLHGLLNRFMLKTMLRATWNADRRGVFLQTSIPLGERALTPEDIMRSASLLLLGARVLVPDINRQLLESKPHKKGDPMATSMDDVRTILDEGSAPYVGSRTAGCS